MIPELAVTLACLFLKEIRTHFPSFTTPSVMFGQVEKESRWKANATLRTSREFGAGLGQFTRAYNPDGTVRFDAAKEMREQFRVELAGWRDDNLYDTNYQLRAVVLKNRTNYLRSAKAADHKEQTAFMLAAYNAGLGMVNRDRSLCANTPGCDPNKWFGNVEKQGFQSKTKWQGYGQSAFDITRSYVFDVMNKLAPKYVAITGA